MPPPPLSAQGSRSGLIATLVVFIVLFLIAAVFGVSAVSKQTKLETDLKEAQKSLDRAASPSMRTGNEYERAAEAGGSAFDTVLGQRDDLAKAIAGSNSYAAALSSAQGAVTAVNGTLAGSAGASGAATRPAMQLSKSQALVPALGQLASSYAKLEEERTNLQGQFDQAQANAQKDIQTKQQQMTDLAAQIMAKDQEIAKVKAEVDSYRQQLAANLQGVSEQASIQMKQVTDQLTAVQAQVGAKEQEAKTLKDELDRLKSILGRFRIDAKESLVRSKDGQITRVPSEGGTCYIDLGAGDGISAGMTFEVYDPIRGIPPLGDGLAETEDVGPRGRSSVTGALGVTRNSSLSRSYPTDMPRGKGSIEVVSVGPGSTSQCRIINVDRTQGVLREGDIIANLVYDRNIKLNFHIYGEFDLDGDGRANTSDATVVKRKVLEWGGRLTEEINGNTDVVVMGLEPVVPNYTAEELQDAVIKDRFDRAQADQARYNTVRSKAIEYGIPILNQNRFLYYTGFFDQKKR